MVELGRLYMLCVSVSLCVCVSVYRAIFKLHESAHWISELWLLRPPAHPAASAVHLTVPTVQQRRY